MSKRVLEFPNGLRYEGTTNREGMPQGKGMAVYPNGSRLHAHSSPPDLFSTVIFPGMILPPITLHLRQVRGRVVKRHEAGARAADILPG